MEAAVVTVSVSLTTSITTPLVFFIRRRSTSSEGELRAPRPGMPFGGITLAPSEHCCSIDLRERCAEDARKARARAAHAAKGLVHCGCQDESEFFEMTCASRNTQVIVVG